MDIVPVLALSALVYTTINFLKYLLNGEWKPAATIFIVWVAGVFAVSLAAHTDFASQIRIIDDLPLDTLNFYSLLFTGLIIGSIGSALNDGKRAVDHNDTAKTPGLFDKVGSPDPGPDQG